MITAFNKPYLFSVILFVLVMPLAATVVTLRAGHGYTPSGLVLVKWFVCFAVGARLLLAGVHQILRPSFTAREIFQISAPGASVVVQELGFANMCLGALGLASVFVPAWRSAALVTGGLFFALAAFRHTLHKPASSNEWVALVSDWFITITLFILFFMQSTLRWSH